MPRKATLFLAVLMTAVWMATELAGGSTNPDVLYRFGMRRPNLWGFSENPLRLLSAMLLHYGVWHLLSNLLSLVLLGLAVERQAGAAGTLFVFFFSGVAGGLASMHWAPQSGSLGASGGIFGLAGALLVLLWRFPDPDRPHNRLLTSLVLLGLLLVMGLQGQLGSYMLDRGGHLGGLAGGLLASVALQPRLDLRWAAGLAALLGCLVWAETSRGPRMF